MMRRFYHEVLFLLVSIVFQSGLYGVEEGNREIRVGALLPLTGRLQSNGLSSQAAIDLAVEDINHWLERNEQPYTLAVEVADTATDPDIALQGIQSMQQKDIQYVVGPFASSSVEWVKPFVDQTNMLVLSPGSSSVSLSLPNDHIYRMVADDSNQGDAVSFYCKKNSISYIIPFYMDDSFGNSLYISTKKWMEERGCVYDDGIKIGTSESDLSEEVEILREKVVAAQALVPSASIAIHLITYDQTIDILRLSMQDTNLSQVHWIGNDGFTGNHNLLSDPEASAFAESVGLVSPIYQLDFDFLAYVERLMVRLQAKLQHDPDALSLQTYDAIWLVFLAQKYRIETGTDDCATALESILPIYRGYTQVIRFNGNGDRYTGMYVFMNVKNKGDRYVWAKKASFSFITTGTETDPTVAPVLNRLLIQVPPDFPEEGSYTLPVLCPLTGSLSQTGLPAQKIFEVVQDDLRNFLEYHGSTAAIALSVYDSQTSSQVALDHLKSLQETHPSPQIIIGPYSSEVLMGVKSFVDENDMILISPASTASSLSIPDDHIYRMTMDDTKEAYALAALIYNEGIHVVLPIWIDNSYGNSLQTSFQNEFEAAQGIVLEGIRYPSDASDFSEVLTEATEKLQTAQSMYPNQEIAILLISFDEGAEILASANGDPDLAVVRWFGSDAIANTQELLDNPNAVDFALSTRFTAAAFAPELDLSAWKTAKGRLVKSYLENFLTDYLQKYGEEPGPFAYSSYDSAWLSAMTSFKVPQNASLNQLVQLMLMTMKYTNGYCELNRVNENGDKGYGTFGFASVVMEDAKVDWKYKSAYHFAYEYDRDDWLEYYEDDDPNSPIGGWELF